jgi:hypothetical protein
MDRGRVGEDRGSKDTDGCPLTAETEVAEDICYEENYLCCCCFLLGLGTGFLYYGMSTP